MRKQFYRYWWIVFTGMEADEQFFRKLQDGYRMEKPKYATNHVDEVMRMCWLTDPNRRPNFASLEDMLGVQLETSVRRHYIDLNDPYVQLNTNRSGESIDYLSMMGPVNYANIGSAPSTELNHYVNAPATAKANKLVNPLPYYHFHKALFAQNLWALRLSRFLSWDSSSNLLWEHLKNLFLWDIRGLFFFFIFVILGFNFN